MLRHALLPLALALLAPAELAVHVREVGVTGDGTTNDTAALRAALESGAKDVYLPAGTYLLGPETIAVPSDVRLHGDGRASQILLAPGTGVLLSLGSDVSMSGLSFDGAAGLEAMPTDPGVVHLPSGADAATLEQLSFRGCRRVSISTDHANDLTIRQCDFREVKQAVSLVFSRRVKVLDNTILGAEWHGIQFWGNWEWRTKDSSDLVIAGNIVRDGGAGAIWGTGATRVVLARNIIDGAKDVGLDLEWCDDSVITGNTVRNCENAGISLFFACQGISITGNTIRNDRLVADPAAEWWVRAGIWLTEPNRGEYEGDYGHRDITIEGNTIVCAEGERRGMWIGRESDNVTIANNTIRGGDSTHGGTPTAQPALLTGLEANANVGSAVQGE